MSGSGFRKYIERRYCDTVRIVLTLEQRYFDVPRDEIMKDSWGRTTFADKKKKQVELGGVSTATFGFYALWLQGLRLLPFSDTSFPVRDFQQERYMTPGEVGHITIAQMENSENDSQPGLMTVARRILLAYFIGQQLGAAHFQDRIMNEIAKHFIVTRALTVCLVNYVYMRHREGCVGLKRFFVDYYIWGTTVEEGKTETRFKTRTDTDSEAFEKFSEGFRKDVDMVKAGNSVYVGEVNFSGIWMWLRDGDKGSQRCRYHQHPAGEMCFNLIVDDEEVQA